MRDLKIIFLGILIACLMIYIISSSFNDWYQCDKNKGVFVRGAFGFECISKEYLR
jgi:hypothetical protein